ncbi:allantoinase AllB [Persicimonas caeni]|uniref:allantoinase AllB n=1 Tax=Persicimonas caeni TaxID=2292766 RepID=UPI001C9BA1B1|nr:allantoinase AllB [Persicimonas caeni]
MKCIRSRRVVTPDGVQEASIHIRDGRIEHVAPYEEVPDGAELDEAGDAVVMAGLVDSHVHINEPGRTDWEGFETATRAAAAGGVTTLVDMPLNSVPATTTTKGFQAKLDAAHGKCHVDVGFWGGVVPGNTDALAALYEAGVLGFKCFLSPSGVDEFQNVSPADLEEAMPVLSELDAVLLCHAELPSVLEDAAQVWQHGNPRHYGLYLASRPRSAEDQAIALMAELSQRFDTRVHIVHVSSATALPFIERAKARGARLTAESCTHYLYFGSDDVAEGATEFKCAPPIRPRGNADELWKALRDGCLDLVATDHSPSPPELKCLDTGRFDEAWGGIASLQLLLPVLWTAARARGHKLEDVAQWASSAPARLAGISERKGSLRPGSDADIVIWDPDAEFTVDAQSLQHRHKLTPYDGRRLQGVVHKTYLRGEVVYDDGNFAHPTGKPLLNPQTPTP